MALGNEGNTEIEIRKGANWNLSFSDSVILVLTVS